MNLGQLVRYGFVERKADLIVEGPLLDLMMDTDTLKDRIINGALSDIFKIPVRTPALIEPMAPISAANGIDLDEPVIDNNTSVEE